MVGLGVALAPEAWVGFAVGGSSARFGPSDGDRADSNQGFAYLWGRWRSGAADVRAWLGGARYDVQTQRGTALGATASADYRARQTVAAVEGRYWFDLETPGLAVAPLVGLQGSWLRQPAYAESGGGSEDFRAQSRSTDSGLGVLGAEWRWTTALGALPTSVEAYAAWGYAFGDRSATVAGTYAGDATQTRLVQSAPAADRSSLQVGVAATLSVSPRSALRLGYQGAFGSGFDAQGVMARWTTWW
jgi:uncharacterized protein with beta-barrel porin domain